MTPTPFGAPCPALQHLRSRGAAQPHPCKAEAEQEGNRRFLKGKQNFLTLSFQLSEAVSSSQPPSCPGLPRGLSHSLLLTPRLLTVSTLCLSLSTAQQPEEEQGKSENLNLNKLTWRWLNKCPNEFSVSMLL